MKKVLIAGLILGMLITSAFSQLKSQLPTTPTTEQAIRIPGLSSALGNLSLLDPSRFSMSHSYSLSFISGGGMNSSLGVYQNTMRYLISDKMFLTTYLGFVHNPLQPGSLNNKSILNNLIYGADLLYHPKQNFWINVSILQGPVYNRWYNPYYYGGFVSE